MFSCCSCNRKEKKNSENDEESEESSSSSPHDKSDQIIETVEEIKFTDYVIIPLKDENYVEEEEEEEEEVVEEQNNTVESKELNIQKNLEKIIEDVEEITVNVDVINSDNTLNKETNKNDDQDDNKDDSCSLDNSSQTVVNIDDKNETTDIKINENNINSSNEIKNNEIEVINDETIQDVQNEIKTLSNEEEKEDKDLEIKKENEENLIENNQNNIIKVEELNEIKNLEKTVIHIDENINIPDNNIENIINNEIQENYDDNNNDVIEISTSFVDPDDEIINDKIIEEDEQEDNYESKESSSSKSSVIMAVNSDEIDNKINGDNIPTPETISPELLKKEFNNDEQLINNNNEIIDVKLNINCENNNNNNDQSSIKSKSSSSNNSEEEEALNICKITIEKGVLGPPKSNGLFHAPGYIERTLIVGPDEDGDDSVFERSITIDDSSITIGDSNNIIADVIDEEEDLIDKNSSILQKPITRWLSQEDDDSFDVSGTLEPPATPIAKDELALRRHKFFSDLIHATNLSANHKVHFDPLGPLIHPGCDSEREDHLEELVTRLENVTKRLESVPDKFIVETQEVAIQTQTPSPKRTNKFIEKIESIDKIDIEIKLNNNINLSKNMSIENYQDIIDGPVAEYLKLSEKIGGDVASHSKLVQQAFQIQLQYIKTASSRPAPSSQSEQVSLLGPLSSQIQAIQEYREKNRGSQYFNHLSAISESIPALGWVAVTPTPAPYVKEMNDAGQFYTNRVLKDWKEKDKTHVEWCKNWVQTLTDLQKYIRQYHTTGLVWSKSGTIGSVPPPPPPSSCGMPPPPPPPTMPIGEIDNLNINDDRSALFAQINKGEDITKNLKKVTSDMQTHKNPSIRSGPAPFKPPVVNNNSGATMKTTLPANAPIDKPPVFSRDGKKWLVEYQKGNKNLLIEDAEMNNVVYMYRCQDSTIVIKGKINSVVMDSCRKSSVVFDSLVSSIEFVNCQSVQMQVLGKVPTISIDKTDGCQMYLNSESLDVEVVSSKSSEMNVMVPKGNGDYTEYPVPEQFKTTVSPKGLTTICVDSLG